jgi:hypothetical protein
VLPTAEIFANLIEETIALFEKKTKDYGTAWRILRLPSLTDQIYIKANRIRSIQEKGVQRVAEGQEEEFIAIMNYCVMALMQIHLPEGTPMEMEPATAVAAYRDQAQGNVDLLLDKNHDYDEAWRQMRVPSITDIILMKLLRIKQIEGNGGQTIVSEGVESGYRDMYNYAAFALAHLKGWA